MKISVMCIGDELLKGATVNTNLTFIGQMLAETGIITDKAMVVPDKDVYLRQAIEALLEDTDILLTTGGLGPTADDITKSVIADFLDLRMEEDINIVEQLTQRWKKLKRGPAPERVLNQALVPEGAIILPNNVGTAPGIWIDVENGLYKGKCIVMFPGPPREIEPMFREYFMKELKPRLDSGLNTRTFYIVGIFESMVEESMQPVLKQFPEISAAYCANPGGVRLFLTCADSDILRNAEEKVRGIFEPKIIKDGYDSLESELVSLLKKKDMTLSVAESCTGGKIGASITNVSGASDIFKGGVIAYSNEIKHNLLGVKNSTLEKLGAVSRECATEMLEGLCERFQTDAGISVTGIAGPSGGTAGKPVGLVYIGVRCGKKKRVLKFIFPGPREMVRDRAEASALNMLRALCMEYEY